jgi:hypothetical protein
LNTFVVGGVEGVGVERVNEIGCCINVYNVIVHGHEMLKKIFISSHFLLDQIRFTKDKISSTAIEEVFWVSPLNNLFIL